MFDVLPEKLKKLAEEAPFPLYVVGGACRDYLAGLDGGKIDWDICSPVGAEQFVAVAENCGFTASAVYKNTGTVKLKADGEEYEFSCFRSDEYVRGVHSPVKIYFTDDMRLDARRRDFKCNAVYYEIAARKFRDPLGGIEDIKYRRISTVADAKKVFGEDGLRLMRLCRQAAQLGFRPDDECLRGAWENRALIRDISAERVWTELNNVLHADKKYGVKYGQYDGLELLKETGVLGEILPEIAAGDKMEQRSDFHDHDVLEHTLRCVKYADDSVRLAALLHDIGKPYCKLKTGKFAKHETEGARIAASVCARLKVPKKLAEKAVTLTALHMYDLNCAARESKVRKFIVKHYSVYDELMLLKQADYSACRDDVGKAPCVEKWEGIRAKMKREGVPFSVAELNVRGNELAEAGVGPRMISRTLDYLLSECAADARLNTKERLLKLAAAFNRG